MTAVFVADHRWINLSADVIARTMRDQRCTINSCVEAACIAVGVAEAFGYLCEPVPVAVQVLAGDQAIILPGPGSRHRPGFAGHLVVDYPGADRIVDHTAGQFHRPDRALYVPPILVLPIPRSRLTPGVMFELPSGATMTMREMDGDVSWKAEEAWYESSALTIGVAVRRLRAALAERDRPARRRAGRR